MFGFGLKVGHLVWMLCCWVVSVVSMVFINGATKDTKPSSLFGVFVKMWEKISGKNWRNCIGSKSACGTWWRKVLVSWLLFWTLVSLWIFLVMSSQAKERRKETLASMCDERSRMLQDQFNVSLNHVQAMSILIATFHHGKNPSAIDQVIGSHLLIHVSLWYYGGQKLMVFALYVLNSFVIV